MGAPKSQHKISNAKGKRKFSFVLIMITIGVSLAIGIYGYIFKRYVLSPYGRFRALHSEIHYPEQYTVRGIDISRYQGKINWDDVKTEAEIISPSDIRRGEYFRPLLYRQFSSSAP